MCNLGCVDFIRFNLSKEEIEGKDILDVGSLNVNGSAHDADLSSYKLYEMVDLNQIKRG